MPAPDFYINNVLMRTPHICNPAIGDLSVWQWGVGGGPSPS